MNSTYPISEREAGFTLLELMVVIVVLGILAAIAVPALAGQRSRTVVASMKSDARSAATQMEAYYAETLSYPVIPPSTVGVRLGLVAVSLTQGNRLETMSGPGVTSGSFCLMVSNPAVDEQVYFDSDAGGLTTSGCR